MQAEVDCRLDHDIGAHVAHKPGQFFHDAIGDIVLGSRPEGRGARRRCLHRGLQVASGDHALFAHGVEHKLGPGFGGLRITRRRKLGRRLQQAGKQCSLRQRHIARRLAEIAPRRRFHSVGARTEIDPVEIHFQDLILGVLVLQPQSHQNFLNLALYRAVGLQEQVLCKLLSQRRAALRKAAAHEIERHGARQADGVNAEMRIVTTVLDGDDSLRNIGRHFVQPDRLAAGNAAICDQFAINRDDFHIRRAIRHGPVGDTGQLGAVPGNQTGRGRYRPTA